MNFSWDPILLSGKLALVTTALLIPVGFTMIYVIHFYTFKLKPLVKAAVSLPLVLPPSVLGFYLLLAFQPESAFGQFVDSVFGIRLIFSFPGLVLASMIFSLPFMINPILSGLENLPSSYEEAAYTLGKSRYTTYTEVLLPLNKPSIIVASIMTFAHTIGEFGVILMIGGSIPKETKVASIAIYHEVEALNYDMANYYALVLLIFSFLVLAGVYFYQDKSVDQWL